MVLQRDMVPELVEEVEGVLDRKNVNVTPSVLLHLGYHGGAPGQAVEQILVKVEDLRLVFEYVIRPIEIKVGAVSQPRHSVVDFDLHLALTE